MKEVDAANIILGEAGNGDRFTIKWGLLKLKLQIKPVTARTLIRISREVCQIKELDFEKAMFPGLMENANSMTYVCRSIAAATDTRFTGIIARAISKLPIKDVQVLWNILVKQSDPQSFFFIIISAKGMNKMKTKEPDKLKEETASSGGSQ